MQDLEDFIKNLDYENYRYYYHITEKGLGQQALEKGLFMKEKELYTTTIEIPKEMIVDPISYCQSEYGGRFQGREEMILIECPKGEENTLVQHIGNSTFWNNDDRMKYKISPDNLLCYIDLEYLIIVYNENNQNYYFSK